ncbi:MAG: phosphate acyltransferase PlsX [Lentisphaerae bacterium]|nr:phosphate acyltransferase PlsX [Lentisphaerota bacterium]
MRIAVDAMGGDYAPREIVKGAVEAAMRLDRISRIILVGRAEEIERELIGCKARDKIEVFNATEIVGMGETPALAVRKKKDSSIGRAVDLVKNGKADAVVSAGNTGAVVVAATLKLRTLAGVMRPAIAAIMPTQKRPFVLIDAGANIDCDATLLMQFAVMGNVYAKTILGQNKPVVGLLSIGGEDSKGNEITKSTFGALSRSSLNFRRNVEGHDLFRGETDVVVCDGFVGNIVLKTTESTAIAIGHWMKQEFSKNILRIGGTILLRGALKAMKKRMNPETYGGAPLLGVNGVCIITHGASSHSAIFHAIRVATDSVHNHLNQMIVDDIARV